MCARCATWAILVIEVMVMEKKKESRMLSLLFLHTCAKPLVEHIASRRGTKSRAHGWVYSSYLFERQVWGVCRTNVNKDSKRKGEEEKEKSGRRENYLDAPLHHSQTFSSRIDKSADCSHLVRQSKLALTKTAVGGCAEIHG